MLRVTSSCLRRVRPTAIPRRCFASGNNDGSNSIKASEVAGKRSSKDSVPKEKEKEKEKEKDKSDDEAPDARLTNAFNATSNQSNQSNQSNSPNQKQFTASTKRIFVRKLRNGVPSFTQQVSVKGLVQNPSTKTWDWLASVKTAASLSLLAHDFDYPVHPATKDSLDHVLSALLASHVPRLPSVSSGIIVLSCPYKGADIYVKSLLEHQIGHHSDRVRYLHIRPEDIFPRLSGYDVTQFPPVVSPSDAEEASNSMTPSGSGGRRKSVGGMTFPVSAGNMFGGSNPAIVVEMSGSGKQSGKPKLPPGFNSGSSGELEPDTPLLPYPWYTPYTTSLHTSKDPKTLLNPRIQSEFPRSDYHDLIHKSFDHFFGSLTTHLSTLGNPPCVIYFEDLLDVITPDASELNETELVNSFANAVSKCRETTPIVVVTASTPSTRGKLVDPQKGVNAGVVNPLSTLMKAIRGADPGAGGGNAGGSSSTGKKVKPVKFHTKLDDYIGPVTIPVYPPLHLGAVGLSAFQSRMKKDLRKQTLSVNTREMQVVMKGFFEEGVEWEKWMKSVEAGEGKTHGRKMLEEKVLSPGEIEQILLFAVGTAVKRFQGLEKGSRDAEGPHVDVTDLDGALETFAGNVKTLGAISAGAEFAGIFANPADHLSLTKHEAEILKTCLIKPTDLNASFKSIGGLAKTKKVIEDLIQLPLMRPELFSFGVLKQSTTGLLLFGPPGTGKTLLAKSIASSSGANFLNVQMSSIQSKWVGENEKNVKSIFSLARKLKPCVIFVDEIDALLKVRVRDQPHWVTNTINEWMLEWDGINSKGSDGIIVVGATNRPFDLDEAVLRRLPRRLFVNLPDADERHSILDLMLSEEVVEEPRADVLDFVVKGTEGFSGSDLKNLCIAAALGSVRRLLAEEAAAEGGDIKAGRVLKQIDFETALESGDVVPSLSEKAELMKELVKWDKMYGLRAGGGRRDSNTGWGFDLALKNK